MTHQYRPEQNGLNIIQEVIAKEALNYVRRILQSRLQIALSYKQKSILKSDSWQKKGNKHQTVFLWSF